MWGYTCGCTNVWAHEHLCLHACWAQRIALGVIHKHHTLSLWDRVSHWGAGCMSATSLRDLPHLCLPVWGLQVHSITSGFYFKYGLEGLNSGPCIHKASTTLSEPSSGQSKYTVTQPISTKQTGHDSTFTCWLCVRKASPHDENTRGGGGTFEPQNWCSSCKSMKLLLGFSVAFHENQMSIYIRYFATKTHIEYSTNDA